MSTMYTTGAVQTVLPAKIADAIILPLSAQSLALTVAATTRTGEHINTFRAPIVNRDPSASWISEGAEIPSSTLGIDEVVSPFFKVGGIVQISRELAEDSSPGVADLVGDGLAREIAREIDRAFFGTCGTGANPLQPRGLEDLEGANVVDAGPAWTTTDPFTEAAYAAEAEGAPLIAFVANPTDALALARLKTADGSNLPLLAGDASQPARRIVGGIPLLASPFVTPGHVWGIPRGRVLLALRQDMRLDRDVSTGFRTDEIALRATLRIAWVFPHEAAVQKITIADTGEDTTTVPGATTFPGESTTPSTSKTTRSKPAAKSTSAF